MLYNEYYERDMDIDDVKDFLINIYEDVCKEQKLNVAYDYNNKERIDLAENPELLDIILHCVNSFGKNHPDYFNVEHLFDD